MAKSLDIIDSKKNLKEKEGEMSDKETDDELKFKKSEGGGVFYLVIGIIAILVATGTALYILYKDELPGFKKKESSEQLAAASKISEETPEATATETQTIEAAVPTNPSPAITFKYTDELIRIANGNKINGEAARIKKILEDKDFSIYSIGNAKRSYSQTTIYYKTGQEKLAEALKGAISGEYSGELKNSDTVVGNYDAVIALGAK